MNYDVTTLRANGTITKQQFSWDSCVLIGYAGRDQESVIAHVEELKAIGVPAPQSVPSMYWASPMCISSATSISVVGDGCSGEVEFFAVFDADGKMHFTVASDHTDRKLETVSVSKAKQACPKVIGNVFWHYDDVKDHWDSIELRSWVTEPGKAERIYQDATLAKLLTPEELYEKAKSDLSALGIGQSFVFCSGTIPLAGAISYKGSFRMELRDPVLQRSIEHAYTVIELPDRN